MALMLNNRIMLSSGWLGIPGMQVLLVFLTVFLSSVSLLSWIKKPKNSPPGPIGLPLVGYLPFLGKNPSKTFTQLAEKYGDIFSIYLGGKYTVILNEFQVMKEAISHPAALNRAPKLFDHIQKAGFISLNGPEWEEQRRFCLQAMRNLGLGRGTWEDLIKEEVNSFVEELKELRGNPIEISHKLSESITSNITSLLIGRRLQKDVEQEQVKLLVDFAEVSFKYMGASDPVTIFPRLRKVFEYFGIAGHGRVASVVSKTCKFMREEIFKHEKLEDSKESEDFIHLYLEQMKKLRNSTQKIKHCFSESILEGNMNILFLAGSDTIFNSMMWILRLMAAYPDVQKKIHVELDNVFGRDGELKYEQRQSVPYTLATMMEMERFGSIVPLNTTRVANADYMIRDFTIPKGAELVGNLWAIHRDPKYWDQPEEFLPERFLSPDGTKILKLPSYVPFSIGKRNCPGETVAWMEIFLYFTSIMQKFKITPLPNERVDMETINGLVIQMKNPQNLRFVERE